MSQPQNTTAEATEGREDPILSVRDLQTVFYTDNETIRAVDSISFDVGRGETVGIVGESGSGKSVTARSIMGLIESPGKVLPGSSISFDGQELTDLSEKQYQSIRGSGIGMVFQDPNSRLTPSTLSATRSVNRLQSTAISRVKNDHGGDETAPGRRYSGCQTPVGRVSTRVLRRDASACRHRDDARV